MPSKLGNITRITFPNLTDGQVAVLQAELATGIVLTTDGRWRLGSGEVYRVFDSLDCARAFARQLVAANPKVECNLYDSQQKHVERITFES